MADIDLHRQSRERLTFNPVVSPRQDSSYIEQSHFKQQSFNDLRHIVSREKGEYGATEARKAVEAIMAREAQMELNSNRDYEPKKPNVKHDEEMTVKHHGHPDYESSPKQHKNGSFGKKSLAGGSKDRTNSEAPQSEKPAPELNKAPLEIDPELCSVTSEHYMASDLFDFKELTT